MYTGFGAGESVVFHEATALQDEEIDALVRHLAALIVGHLRRCGFLDEEGKLDPLAGDDLDALGTCHAAAIQGVIPFGAKAGQRTLLWGEAEEASRTTRVRLEFVTMAAGLVGSAFGRALRRIR